MAAPTDVLTRIDEIESELCGLSVELREIRTIVTQVAIAPAAAPASRDPPPPANRPRAIPPVDPAARLDAAIGAAQESISPRESGVQRSMSSSGRSSFPAPAHLQALRRLGIDPRGNRPLSVLRACAGR